MSKSKPTPQAAPPDSVQAAIKQVRPFKTPRQEAMVALLLTAETVRWPLHDLLTTEHDLTLQQYNVLRILRGAGADGLPTLEIVERMIERAPGITRLLDRLETKGLVARERAAGDRRQVLARITDRGLDLLRRLDRPIDAMDHRLFAGLADKDIAQLVRLLNKVRLGGAAD